MIAPIAEEDYTVLPDEDKVSTFLDVQSKAITLQDQYIALLNDVRTDKYQRVAIEKLLDAI
jgi:hypothetical protein